MPKIRVIKDLGIAGVAERPFKGEPWGLDDITEPTILIGEKLLKEGYEDAPGYQILAHEIYHQVKSPRRKVGGWAVTQSEPNLPGLEDEVEAIMFASQSTGNPPTNLEIKGVKEYAKKVGLDSESWTNLVKEIAGKLHWRGHLGFWYY